MPPRAAKPKRMVGRVFRATEAIDAGLVTRRQLRSNAWRQVFRGIYADAGIDLNHRLRCEVACAYLIPEAGVITGRSAAMLYGVPLMPDEDPVEVLVPAPFGPVTGLKVLFGRTPDDEIHRRAAGIRLASPARTCWDLARHRDLVDVVVYLDALLRLRVITLDELTAYAWQRSGERGCRTFMQAVRLADPGAESPQESRLRVGLVLRGVPRPVSQYVINRGGAFVARVDLAWPELRVAVEYDGRWHGDPAQLERDRARLNRLVGAGWIVLHVTADRMRNDFDGFVRELMEALKIRSSSGK